MIEEIKKGILEYETSGWGVPIQITNTEMFHYGHNLARCVGKVCSRIVWGYAPDATERRQKAAYYAALNCGIKNHGLHINDIVARVNKILTSYNINAEIITSEMMLEKD